MKKSFLPQINIMNEKLLCSSKSIKSLRSKMNASVNVRGVI